ncbi:MAG: PP2C family protein-serine/threonine phosphatase [Brevinematia bacterium]
MKKLIEKKHLYLGLITLVFVGLLGLSIRQLFLSLEFSGKKLPPFLVTRQLGVDAIGMFLKPENFTKILPQSYIKEVNGVPVKNDKEFYQVILNLPENAENVDIKFANPFFFTEEEYKVRVNLYSITYIDFLVLFLIPVLFSTILFSIAYYLLAVMLLKSYHFTNYKKQMFLSASTLFFFMGVLVISGLDLVNRKEFLPILYISFGTINIALSIFFYYLSYHRIKQWLYVIVANILVSSLLLTGYLTFFNNAKILISIVKVNYIVIALNVIAGIVYLFLVRKSINNTIEKERIKLIVFVLFIPIFVLGIVFLIQGISFYTVPISIFFLLFIAVSPIVSMVINDHNVKLSKERMVFSVITSVAILLGFVMLSSVIINVPEESLFLFGIYGIPSVLFFSVVLWYGIENRAQIRADLFEISPEIRNESIKMHLFSKLKKRFGNVRDVKIILQYPLVYGEEEFDTYLPYSEFWDEIEEHKVVTINDIFFDKTLSKFEKVFQKYRVEYLFGFQISNNKCIVGISTNSAISRSELEQIEMIVNSFSIDLQSFAVINSVKFMKVLNLEFDLLKQSQTNLLKSNRSISISTPEGKINVLSYWEPMIDLAGDIYGVTESGIYLTSWISDICGKGLTAAAISFTCYTLINQIIKNNLGIGKSVEIINDILVNEPLFSIDGFFLTLSGITINTESLEAEIINCGNPPVIFFDGEVVKEINPKGGIVGIFDDFQYDSVKLKLRKGMILLFFSDGATDIRGIKEVEEGDWIENLKDTIANYRTPEMIWEHLTKSFQNLSLHKNIIDDITVSMVYVE